MGVIRIDQITGRFFIVQDGYAPQSNPGPDGVPLMSLISHGGVLQRMYEGMDEGEWSVQIFESANPVVSFDAENIHREDPRQCMPSHGCHYILNGAGECHTPREECQKMANIMVAMQDRIRVLYEQPNVGYVAVFADMHTNDIHSPNIQVATLPAIPPAIQAEMDASDRFAKERGVCAICEMIKDVDNKHRLVMQTDNFMAFSPWAPSSPYEFWIAPRLHVNGFLQTSQREMEDLGLILRSTLGGIRRVLDNCRFGMAFHFSPDRRNSSHGHWHIEVYPDVPPPSALERGFGIVLSGTSPEDAASKLAVASQAEIAHIMGVK